MFRIIILNNQNLNFKLTNYISITFSKKESKMNKEDIFYMSACDMVEKIKTQEMTSVYKKRFFFMS